MMYLSLLDNQNCLHHTHNLDLANPAHHRHPNPSKELELQEFRGVVGVEVTNPRFRLD